MKIKSKYMLVSVLFILFFGFIVACSSGDETSSSDNSGNDSGDDSSTSNDSSDSSTEEVVLDLWDFQEGDEEYDRKIEEFNESHPNIEIKRTVITRDQFDAKLINAAAADQLPDIFINSHSRFQSLAEAGIAGDITDLIEESGLADKFFSGLLPPQKYEGKFFGLPLYNNDLALYYNKDMFEEVGLTEPPKTWEEIREYAKKLTKDGVYGLAMAGSKNEQGTFNFLPWIWQAGADLDSLDSEKGINAIEFRQALIHEDGSVSQEMLNWEQNDANLQFLSERAAMQINGSWNVPTLNKEADFEWAAAELPKGETKATIVGGEAMGITATTDNLEEAFEWFKFFYDEENYTDFILENGNLPSVKAAAETPEIKNDPNMQVFTEQLNFARSRAYGSNYPEISNIVAELVQATVLGKDAETIAKEAQEKITPLLP
ncbi:ABC transporter substrate-binding protein [Aquibacillus albus]|uniref:Multiple sugar transport system substrate-binding protein n=1 Tax=Aquibacillus albus TaxID=1168171 RepID=A0ABS2MW84_9BACI|nr:sugar ABC transporter substrate-binding protein [Aquibacillus albus]MBM7570155.1 multiple sugar transport system substrate-binding protein [Aquibacillus albus]